MSQTLVQTKLTFYMRGVRENIYRTDLGLEIAAAYAGDVIEYLEKGDLYRATRIATAMTESSSVAAQQIGQKFLDVVKELTE